MKISPRLTFLLLSLTGGCDLLGGTSDIEVEIGDPYPFACATGSSELYTDAEPGWPLGLCDGEGCENGAQLAAGESRDFDWTVYVPITDDMPERVDLTVVSRDPAVAKVSKVVVTSTKLTEDEAGCMWQKLSFRGKVDALQVGDGDLFAQAGEDVLESYPLEVVEGEAP